MQYPIKEKADAIKELKEDMGDIRKEENGGARRRVRLLRIRYK